MCERLVLPKHPSQPESVCGWDEATLCARLGVHCGRWAYKCPVFLRTHVAQ